MRDSVRKERESSNLSRGEEGLVLHEQHSLIHTRAQITRCTTPPFANPLFLSPTLDRCLDVPFSPCFSCLLASPRVLVPSFSGVWSREPAGPAITRSWLTVAPCMAACFMLPASHCDAQRASERKLGPLHSSVETRTRYPAHRTLGCF